MKIKTLFISDVHLGNPNSQPKKLLEVFKLYEFENLYIIGDFIDMTYLKRHFYWNQDHSLVIQKVLRYSRKSDIKVTILSGNHDYFLRNLIDEGNINIGNIKISDKEIYTTIKGEKILIVHGDCFDGFIKTHPFLYWLGDNSYELSMKLNKIINFFRKLCKLQYWSLSAYLKTKVKDVIKFLTEYKKQSLIEVKNNDCDSIMMGHTHSPCIEPKYYNTGDWVESCSYIIENLDGSIELKFYK